MIPEWKTDESKLSKNGNIIIIRRASFHANDSWPDWPRIEPGFFRVRMTKDVFMNGHVELMVMDQSGI